MSIRKLTFRLHWYAGLARTIYIYTVCIRYFWQGNHQIYDHIRCINIRFWPTLLVCHDVLILAVPPFLFVSCVGLAKLYICTVYDRIYGDFPAKNTVCTLYIHINVWFWPTLLMCHCTPVMQHQLLCHISLPAVVHAHKAMPAVLFSTLSISYVLAHQQSLRIKVTQLTLSLHACLPTKPGNKSNAASVPLPA
jgi:hypothetical protein